MSESKPIVFMYSGQGSQYYNMGRVLFEQEPVFRDWMLRLDQAASALIGESLLEKLYDGKRKITEVFDRTLFTHPAIYMVEIAMTQLLLANDIHPDYVMGESLGEFAAATTAGITDWETGLEMVIQQARTIEACCVEGGMLAVLGDISLYTDSIYLRERCELASVLHNSHFVLTGGKDAIGEIAEWLSRKQIMKEPLPVSHAFHSTLLHAAEDSVQRNYSQKKVPSGNRTVNIGNQRRHAAGTALRVFMASGPAADQACPELRDSGRQRPGSLSRSWAPAVWPIWPSEVCVKAHDRRAGRLCRASNKTLQTGKY